MTVLNTGSTKKYAEGWEALFGGRAARTSTKNSRKKSATKKPVTAAKKKGPRKARRKS